MTGTAMMRRWKAWLFMLPGLAVFLLFLVIPIVVTIIISFTEYDSLNAPTFVFLDQYNQLLSSDVFRKSLVNSALLAAGIVLTLTVLPIPVAYMIERNIRSLGWVRALFYLPVITPIIVSAVAWRWILTEEGILNWVLVSIGILGEPVRWLTDPSVALWSVLMVIFWRSFGFYLIIYISGLLGVPKELYEAASVDGAGRWKTFVLITLPLLRNTIALVTIVSFINAMKIFDEIFILTRGGPVNSTKTTSYFIYEEAFVNFKFGYSSAMAVILLVIVTAVTMLLLNFFEKDEVKY
ncbi:carbohydrate ABC transporter permease [Paenibacillus daejeonensis]|uniref:carbohydrate ABC transporter permease n=1 Tax=Paenibacillus daejeonensis TaxID=135193 RepID=UPI0003633FF7|nr:sugar ABC transporter permease [Paenibacillus daejeonensis]